MVSINVKLLTNVQKRKMTNYNFLNELNDSYNLIPCKSAEKNLSFFTKRKIKL